MGENMAIGKFGRAFTGGAILLVAAGSAAAADAPPRVDTSQPTTVVYPKSAQVSGEEGTVMVRVFVNTSGRAARASVAQSSGFMDLDNAAVETAMNWRYVPAIHDGDTASDWATVQVVYKLPAGEPARPPGRPK
jgi:TonB family protein